MKEDHGKLCGITRKVGSGVKHGLSHVKAYRSWQNMLARCLYPKHKMYHRYGGRGIKVCDQWKNFATFYADMGDRPDGMSLDRRDPNGHYEPGNCRWANKHEQDNNRCHSRHLEFGGKRLTINEWAYAIGIKPSTLFYRLKRGWSIEGALTTPKTDKWHGQWGKANGRY